MEYHKTLISCLFILQHIAYCSSKSIRYVQKNDDYDVKDQPTTDDSLKESTSSHIAELPKCLSFKNEDEECELINSFYKSPERRKRLNLDNIVFIMFIHNNELETKLLKAHCDTWIRRLGFNTDIIFVTDEDDQRSFEEIFPYIDKVRSNLSVYKSPAKKEGSRLRYKVADAFQYVSKKYENDETKEYFMKIDTDTYVLPVALMDLIREIDEATNPQPVLFGKQRCSYPEFCYSAGPLYGINKFGFNALAKYLSDHEEILDEVHPRINGLGNLMEVSLLIFVFKLACTCIF